MAGEQSAGHARLGVYAEIFRSMDWFSCIFGHGFGRIIEGEWMPGLAYTFYGAGFIGLLLISRYLCKVWKNGLSLQKGMVLVFCLTFVESGVFMNMMVIVYMLLMNNHYEKESVSHEKNTVSIGRLLSGA